MTELNKPEIKKGINSYSYTWNEIDIRVDVNRLTDDGHAELSFYHLNGNGPALLSWTAFNLLSSSAITGQIKRLKEHYLLDCWDTVLTYVTALTLSDLRRGEPIEWVGGKPESMKVEYQLYPILQYKQPTTLYGPGGGGKSYLAAYMACLIQFNWTGFANSGHAWLPRQGNVLYLDWEDTTNQMKHHVWVIKQGLKDQYPINDKQLFAYRKCKTSLYDDLPYIQQMVFDYKIEFVIIDSQMAATEAGTNEAQLATQFYNAIRSLDCTTLTLDHMAKNEIRGTDDPAGPIGSVVKFNRSRAQFQLQTSQNAGDDFTELSLVNKKNNNGKLLLPFGIRIDFVNGDGGTLEEVKFSPCNLADNPKLEKTATLKDRIKKALEEKDKTPAELADELSKPENTIRMELTCKVNKELFYKTGNKDEKRREYWRFIRENSHIPGLSA